MHRTPLLELLARHEDRFPDDRERINRIRSFVESHPDCFERTCRPGHITASAWILSADRQQFLLAHHRKLDRWLQLGGHADGDPHVEQVALREAREESGMEAFELLKISDRLLPIDVDVHEIPKRSGEPAHWHYDIRFPFIAGHDQQPIASDESHAVRWFDVRDSSGVLIDASLRRMAARARRLFPPLNGAQQ